jgi:hypothetical protein
MIIFDASMHAEDLVMLSFAVRLCERHAMAAMLIGCARRIRAAAANWRHAAIASVTDPYRPELHYMRGPGPKYRQKHAAQRHRAAASLPSPPRRIVEVTSNHVSGVIAALVPRLSGSSE